MTIKRSSEFLRDDMNLLHGIFGIKSHEGNISVEMCSEEFFLKHALTQTQGQVSAHGSVLQAFARSQPLQTFATVATFLLHGFTLRLSSLFIKRFWAWLLAIFAK